MLQCAARMQDGDARVQSWAYVTPHCNLSSETPTFSTCTVVALCESTIYRAVWCSLTASGANMALHRLMTVVLSKHIAAH